MRYYISSHFCRRKQDEHIFNSRDADGDRDVARDADGRVSHTALHSDAAISVILWRLTHTAKRLVCDTWVCS